MTTEWNGILDVLAAAGELKRVRRQGWIDRGVVDPESVADHSYRMALLAVLLALGRPGLDPARAMALALVHDLPEAVTGDITPFDETLGAAGVDREAVFRRRPAYSEAAERAKRVAEAAAIREIAARLPAPLAAWLVGAWEEYEAGETPEARLVRQVDKLETLVQALEYKARQPDLVIESFAIGTDEAVRDPALRELVAAVWARLGPGTARGAGE